MFEIHVGLPTHLSSVELTNASLWKKRIVADNWIFSENYEGHDVLTGLNTLFTTTTHSAGVASSILQSVAEDLTGLPEARVEIEAQLDINNLITRVNAAFSCGQILPIEHHPAFESHVTIDDRSFEPEFYKPIFDQAIRFAHKHSIVLTKFHENYKALPEEHASLIVWLKRFDISVTKIMTEQILFCGKPAN